MSFFIRKNGRVPSKFGSESKNPRQKNKDVKLRPRHSEFGAKHAKAQRRKRNKIDNIDTNFGKGIGRKRKIDKDEEIISSSEASGNEDNDEGLDESLLGKKPKVDESEKKKVTSDEEYEDETAQEKKIRLAKLYLEEIEREEKERRNLTEIDDDLIANRLREDQLEHEGRLRREIADLIQPDLSNVTILKCPKYLKNSVTCLCISGDDKFIFSGCKDGHLIKWSVTDKQKVDMVKRKEVLSKRKKKKGHAEKANSNPNSCHSSAILAIAISTDGKFLATGDKDNQVVIWDPDTLKRIHIFTGHRGPIRGLAFRKKTHTLFSCSEDKTVRIWSLDEMGYVETLFGHQDAVTCVDALSRERAITGGGRDNSIRVWKIAEESQLVYNGHYNGNIDCVKLVNEENFVSGGEDGHLCTWNVNRKKPQFVIDKAHGVNPNMNDMNEEGSPRWITAVSSWTNSDLIASGSSDGFIRFWKCGDKFKSLTEVFNVPCSGWINALEFSTGVERGKMEKFIAAGVGKEHRLGRWFDNVKDAKQCIVLIPLVVKSK